MYCAFKRILDIIIASIALVALFPLMILIAACVLLFSGRPVFYYQERVGKNWQPFRIIKFRTMVAGAEKMGPGISSGDDSRITGIGRILRKFKLDELPQFFNVLKGDMSVIGPRPELFKYAKCFYDDYTLILKYKPGITDYASVFYRDEAALLINREDKEQFYITEILPSKINLYKKYISEIGFFTDVKILFDTIRGLIK